jgi:hypothetical protein
MDERWALEDARLFRESRQPYSSTSVGFWRGALWVGMKCCLRARLNFGARFLALFAWARARFSFGNSCCAAYACLSTRCPARWQSGERPLIDGNSVGSDLVEGSPFYSRCFSILPDSAVNILCGKRSPQSQTGYAIFPRFFVGSQLPLPLPTVMEGKRKINHATDVPYSPPAWCVIMLSIGEESLLTSQAHNFCLRSGDIARAALQVSKIYQQSNVPYIIYYTLLPSSLLQFTNPLC